MASFTYATLTTAIQDYTEVGTSVFTSTITDQFIANAEERIFRDVNIDAYRYYDKATLNIGQGTYNNPAGGLVVRAIKLTDSNGSMWYLQKVDQTFLDEYIQDSTVPGTPSDPPRSNLFTMPCFNLVKEPVMTLIILKLDPLRMLLTLWKWIIRKCQIL